VPCKSHVFPLYEMFYIPVVNKVTLGHVFLQVATSVFPCKHHSATVLHSHFIHLPSTLYFSFPMALQPNSALGRLTVDVSKSHTIGHTRTHTHTRAHTHARTHAHAHTRCGPSEQVISSSQTPLPAQHKTHVCLQRDWKPRSQ
jgi:hypothetical protein